MDLNLNNATYPRVVSTVTDNSTVSASTPVSTSGTVLNAPIIADRGNDTDTLEFYDTANLILQYGTPNFKKHGQSIYNVVRWIENKGVANTYRITSRADVLKQVLPESITYTADMDAKYANAIFVVKINEDEVTKEVKIILDTYSKTDYNAKYLNSDEFDNDSLSFSSNSILMNEMKNHVATELITLAGETEAKTFKVFPLFALEVKGSGIYGNNLSFTLNPNTRYDDTFDYRVYELGVYEKKSSGGMVKLNTFLVSFYPEAMSPAGNALFIEKVVNLYADDYTCTFCETKYNELMLYLNTLSNTYFKDTDGNNVFDSVYDIDYLFGLTRGHGNINYSNPELTTPIKLDVINNTDKTLIDVTNITAMKFKSGSDGAMASGFANRDAIIDLLYGAYFEGLFTSDVNDKSMYETDIMLDFGLSTATKTKLANLAKTRFDMIAIEDTGFISSASPIASWREKFEPNTCYASIFGHAYTVYDAYTNSDIKVTSTYILAGLIPYTDYNNSGVHTPFVGPNNGRFTGFSQINFVPTTIADKQIMHQNKINYVERDKSGVYYNEQITTQASETALSNLNNVRVLCRIIRNIEKIAKKYMFKYATSSELNAFQTDVNNKLSEYIGTGACKEANGTVSQTQYEQEMNTCSVGISLKFNDLLKTFNINYTIGR